jgi:ankyrin repeat protein
MRPRTFIGCFGVVSVILLLNPAQSNTEPINDDDSTISNRKLLQARTVLEIKSALDVGANINVRNRRNGQTLLMSSVLQGKEEFVHYLLKLGADTTISEKDGYTPPHGAGFQGRATIMKLLFENGINVNEIHTRDKYYPIHRACWGRDYRHTETVRYLVKYANVSIDIKGGPEQKTCFEMTTNPQTKKWIQNYMNSNNKKLLENEHVSQPILNDEL